LQPDVYKGKKLFWMLQPICNRYAWNILDMVTLYGTVISGNG